MAPGDFITPFYGSKRGSNFISAVLDRAGLLFLIYKRDIQQWPPLPSNPYYSLPVAKRDPQESWRGTFKIIFLLYIATERHIF